MSFLKRIFGGGGGGGAPDYGPQREAERQRIQSSISNDAGSWNNAATGFNQGISQLANQRNEILNRHSGLSIANSDGLKQLEKDVDWLDRTLDSYRNMAGTATKPTFTQSQSLFGQNVNFDVPSLTPLDTSTLNRLEKDLSGLTSRLGNLRSERATEERRLRDFTSSLGADLAGLNEFARGLDITNPSAINDTAAALGSLRFRFDTFDSPLGARPTLPGGLSFDAVSQQLNNLRATRAAEEQRIRDQRNALFDASDRLRGRVGGLSIANLDGINALQAEIDSVQSGAGRFSSLLPADFSGGLGELDQIEGRLADLRAQRGAEEQRVAGARNNFLSEANALSENLARLGIFSREDLDAAGARIGGVERQIGGFSSVLPADFGDVRGALSSGRSRLDDLMARRNTALANLGTRAQTLASGVADIPLFDEAALLRRRDDIQAARGDLNPFTGFDVQPVAEQYNRALDAVRGRVDELTRFRGDIEKRAQALLEEANAGRYIYADDLADPRKRLEALQRESDLYKAMQALDEIDAITKRLSAEQKRMEADAAQVRARGQAEQQAMSEAPKAIDLGLMTPEEYAAYIMRRRQEDPLFVAASPTSFSANLGLAA